MDLGKIIHERKTFVELENADVEAFLRDRKFRSEHLNLEFKSSFPQKSDGRFDLKKICKYIVGYSNEEGGLVVYGVSDEINKPEVPFPNYVLGLTACPSLENLSQWVNERVQPLIASPEIREFRVADKRIMILKIHKGVNKPYLYYEPDLKTASYFKKTAGGIEQLLPDQIREFYRTQIIEQSDVLLRAAEFQGWAASRQRSSGAHKLNERKEWLLQNIEDVTDFGFVGIYSSPLEKIKIPVPALQKFLLDNRSKFSEAMRYFPNVEIFQSGVSAGFFPRAIRQDAKSTMRISFYEDGFVTFGALADTFMSGRKNLNPYWLAYELQRHLQLSKSLLKGFGVSRITLNLTLEHLTGFSLTFGAFPWIQSAQFQEHFEPIQRDVDFSDIYDHDGAERNVAIPFVREIIEEVCRAFGLSRAPSDLYDKDGVLSYVKGLEHQR